MKSNTDLLINAIKSNLTGNTERDILYLNEMSAKYADNEKLMKEIPNIKKYLEENRRGKTEPNICTGTCEADTSIDDGVLQEKTKKKKSKAERAIRDIKVLFRQGTADSEIKLVCYELPKLKSLYENTSLAVEKETVRLFANYNYNGLTPLHLACYYEEFELVKFFVSIGANINAKLGIYDITPLDYLLYDNKNENTSEENRKQIEMLLIDNGAVRGFTIKRNMGLIILAIAASAAFLVLGIVNPLFIAVAAMFIILTTFFILDCKIYKSKKKKTAVLLAVIGGAIGLHKFYLNDISAAFKHIIISLFTIFIGGIILGYADVSKIKNDELLEAKVLKLKN